MTKKIHPLPSTPHNFELGAILSRRRRHKADLQSKYMIHRLAVFGVYARGEQTSDSDIDILVELCDKPLGLASFSMVREVAALFPLKTEVVSRDEIKKDV